MTLSDDDKRTAEGYVPGYKSQGKRAPKTKEPPKKGQKTSEGKVDGACPS